MSSSERIWGYASPMLGWRSANLRRENGGLPSDPSDWRGAAMMRCSDSWVRWRMKGSAARFKPSFTSCGRSSIFYSGSFIRSRPNPRLIRTACCESDHDRSLRAVNQCPKPSTAYVGVYEIIRDGLTERVLERPGAARIGPNFRFWAVFDFFTASLRSRLGILFCCSGTVSVPSRDGNGAVILNILQFFTASFTVAARHDRSEP